MNALAFLTVVFGILSIILFFALLMLAQSHREWRTLAMQWTETGKEMMAYCDQLEARNAYLEDVATHSKDVLAGAILFTPRFMAMRGNQLVVTERQEMP